MLRSAEAGQRRGPARTVERSAVAAAWLLAALAALRDGLLTFDRLVLPDELRPGSGRPGAMQDFRDTTYYPVRELFRSGGMPYEPASMFGHWPVGQEFDLYLPAHLWLHAPLAALPYRQGAVAMFLLDVALLVVLAGWTVRWAIPGRYAALAWPLLTLGLLVSQVGKAQLALGQVNPLVAIGTAGALGWRDRPRLAAACLALAWIKPQFGLPLTVFLLVRGAGGRSPSSRVAWTGTALAALASLPVLAVLVARAGGPGGFLDVVRHNLAAASTDPATAVDNPAGERVDLAAVTSRLFGWTPSGLAQAGLTVAVLVVTAAVLIAATGLSRASRTGATGLSRASRTGAAGQQCRTPGVLLDLVCVLAMLVAAVHQPGDALAALPAAIGVGALGVRRLLPSAVLVAVPFLDLAVVRRAATTLAGERLAVTLAGLALVLAWAWAVLSAARSVAPSGDSPVDSSVDEGAR